MPSPVRFSVVRKVLEDKGYTLTDISGWHHIFRKPGVRPQSVPVYHGQVKYAYFRRAQKAQ